VTEPRQIKPVAEWTADEIVAIIPKVLHDAQAVEMLLRLLAVRDPHRAETVLAAIEFGLALRGRQDTDP